MLGIGFVAQKDPLKVAIAEKIPREMEKIKRLMEKHRNSKVCDVSVDQIYQGMRGVTAMSYETSLLDPNNGIMYRGLSIPQMIEQFPKINGNEEPVPEALFWFLTTGDIPTEENVRWLINEWARRSNVPSTILKLIDAFGDNVHPMAQLSAALSALSYKSKFAKAFNENVKKSDYWHFIYEDCMDLIAKIPTMAAKIYRNTYHNGVMKDYDHKLDWTCNYVNMLGFSDEKFSDFMRLYFIIHADHEGGNVSTHTNKLVSSALSDPYMAFAAAINGLAGPLHGRANQQVVMWIEELIENIGVSPTDNDLRDYCIKCLKQGVIPGYGHAVLRKTDPRFLIQRSFGLRNLPDHPEFKLVLQLYKLVPDILSSLGKVKNPWPNVDAISGTILDYYGLIENEYYTVPFGVSRSLGTSASLIWDRIFNLPLERPKSITTESLMVKFGIE